MASGRPWYKRSGGDFVMATLGMPDADHKWAYSAIIDMLNDRDRPLADEAAFIVGFTGLTKQKWGRVRAYLIDHGYLALTSDGRLTNPRFEREQAERDAAHDQAVAAGRAGGKKSAAMRAAGQGDLDLGQTDQGENLEESSHVSSNLVASLSEETADIGKQKPRKSANGGQPPPQATRARKRLEAREESHVQPPSPIGAARIDPHGLSDQLCRIAGVRNVEPARIIANDQIVREWLALGVGVVEMEQAILNGREQSPRPVHSLKYFDPPIRRDHARKEHPHARDRNDPAQIADPLLRRYVENGGSLDSRH